MNNMMMISTCIIIAAIFTIMSNSYGIQCYNDNDDYKNNHESKFGFTVFCLILAIFALIGGGAGIVLSYRGGMKI